MSSYTTAAGHTGARSARLGLLPGARIAAKTPGWIERTLLGEAMPEGATISSVYQTVTLPAGTSATLRFWYRPGTMDTANDFQRVLLLDPITYRLLDTVMVTLENATSWREAPAFDLAAYRGRSVVVYFETYNDSIEAEGRTWMFVDEVRVEVYGGPHPRPPLLSCGVCSSGEGATVTQPHHVQVIGCLLIAPDLS